MEKQELIWVDKEFAERYKVLETDAAKHAAFDEYTTKLSKEARDDFKANLEGLEEDVAIYTGLMLKVKQAFEKASSEQLKASYALWESFDKERPNITAKIDNLLLTLKPLADKLTELDKTLKSIQHYNVEELIKTVEKLSGLYGTNKEMITFLMNNFKREV